ncbi:sigma-54 dependent transcriptional regulator [Geobacter sp.]|uniref:sigma-54-dependent transcriptional regulator n=1 Tax=Geobacter sp. TaxID=46610 RepID=UPI0027B87FE9|nr:sigma-54 dependent transcriptional regulator [Geobacter sp.]
MAAILIIDDDESMRSSLWHMVKRMGHQVESAATLGEGLEKAAAGAFDVVLLDVSLPDGNGLDVLPDIQRTPGEPEVIIITGYGNPDSAELAIRSGAWDYIEKGTSLKAMTLHLVRALQYRQEKIAGRGTSVTALKRHDIVGNSHKMRDCLDLVAQAAAGDTSVMITGETGTGKELFARAIHNNSRRVEGNFVVVDCAALPETLVESLLFGHEKGTFTGAEKAREGLIQQAHGGSLFLDEVGELPLSVQKAFLRVLQERRFRPLGGQRELASDFRLISATNRDLDQMVRDGSFRDDLLFRLRAFAIELPPLRERPEDIKELARHHVDRLCDRYGLAPKGFAPEFLDTLTRHSWPGNVRELVNTLERALAAARTEPTLFPQHLPLDMRVQIARAAVEQPAAEADPQRITQSLPRLQDFRETVFARAEKEYLRDLLSLTGSDLKEACRIAGLSLSRLYALLSKHDLKPS